MLERGSYGGVVYSGITNDSAQVVTANRHLVPLDVGGAPCRCARSSSIALYRHVGVMTHSPRQVSRANSGRPRLDDRDM